MSTIGEWWYRKIDEDTHTLVTEPWTGSLPEGALVFDCDFLNQFIDRVNLRVAATKMLGYPAPSFMERIEPGTYEATYIAGIAKKYADKLLGSFYGLWNGGTITSGTTLYDGSKIVNKMTDVFPGMGALVAQLRDWETEGKYLPGMFEKMREIWDVTKHIKHARMWGPVWDSLFTGDMGIGSGGNVGIYLVIWDWDLEKKVYKNFSHTSISFPIDPVGSRAPDGQSGVIFNNAYHDWAIANDCQWNDLYAIPGIVRRTGIFWGGEPEVVGCIAIKIFNPKIKLKAPGVPIKFDASLYQIPISLYDEHYKIGSIPTKNALYENGYDTYDIEKDDIQELPFDDPMGADVDTAAAPDNVWYEECRIGAMCTIEIDDEGSPTNT